MECELVHKYEVRQDSGMLSNTVVFGRVKRFHAVSTDVFRLSLHWCIWMNSTWSNARLIKQKEFIFDPNDPMKVLPEKIRSVSRLGGVT